MLHLNYIDGELMMTDAGLRRLAATMKVLTLAGMVATAAGAVLTLTMFDDLAAAALARYDIAYDAARFGWDARLTVMGLWTVGPLLLIAGLWRLHRAFGEAAEGRPFSAVSTSGFRGFAAAILAWAIYKPVVAAVSTLVLSVVGGPGGGKLAIDIGSDTLAGIFVALLVLMMAQIFDRGRALADENAAFL
jgi:hypothetical protein